MTKVIVSFKDIGFVGKQGVGWPAFSGEMLYVKHLGRGREARRM